MVGKRDENGELRQRELLFLRLRQVVRRDWWMAEGMEMVRQWPWEDDVQLVAESMEQAS